MHGEGFFYQAFVYLTAAVVSVPVARRLGLGSVLGYLIAGVAIGPFALGLVGSEGQDVMHFAEFGVVMMLFVVGLELEPSLLWRLRGPILGLGGLQVLVSALAIGAVGVAAGLPWRAATAVGAILALSSTAIVLQTLSENGLMRLDAGQRSFAVLLFQDIAVIPMLALLPLLAAHGGDAGHGGDHGGGWVAGLPAWGRTLAVLGAVALVILGGRYVARPALRFVARSRLREIFTAAALLLVIGIALLMSRVGLSPALGTFLAGVVLANSEYRHELESDLEPFKGLLLGLFFIAVGASIDFALIAASPGLVAALVAALIAIKLVVLGRAFGLGLDQNLMFAFALAQGGEFAFVLFSFAVQNDVLGAAVAQPLVAVVALSMALTPLLMLVNEKLVQPRFGTRERAARGADEVHGDSPVIIAGFGRFGHIVGRLLVANGIRVTVLDVDSDQVDMLRRLGLEVFYGDASRHDLLELGVDDVYREHLDTSLRVGVDVLRALGMRGYAARRSALAFRAADEESVRLLAPLWHDRGAYVSRARERIRDIERCMRDDARLTPSS